MSKNTKEFIGIICLVISVLVFWPIFICGFSGNKAWLPLLIIYIATLVIGVVWTPFPEDNDNNENKNNRK